MSQEEAVENEGGMGEEDPACPTSCGQPVKPCPKRKKRKVSYLWRPPPPSPRPSYSPCPHIYFKNLKAERQKELSRDEHIGLLSTPSKHPWQKSTLPRPQLVRYKKREVTARNIQLAVPKLERVQALFEEQRDCGVLEISRLERLEAMLQEEFLLSPVQAKKIVKSVRRRKKKKLEVCEPCPFMDERIPSTEFSRENFVKGMITEMANHVSDVTEIKQGPTAKRLGEIVTAIMERIEGLAEDDSPPPDPAQSFGEGKLSQLLVNCASRMAGWIENVVFEADKAVIENFEAADAENRPPPCDHDILPCGHLPMLPCGHQVIVPCSFHTTACYPPPPREPKPPPPSPPCDPCCQMPPPPPCKEWVPCYENAPKCGKRKPRKCGKKKHKKKKKSRDEDEDEEKCRCSCECEPRGKKKKKDKKKKGKGKGEKGKKGEDDEETLVGQQKDYEEGDGDAGETGGEETEGEGGEETEGEGGESEVEGGGDGGDDGAGGGDEGEGGETEEPKTGSKPPSSKSSPGKTPPKTPTSGGSKPASPSKSPAKSPPPKSPGKSPPKSADKTPGDKTPSKSGDKSPAKSGDKTPSKSGDKTPSKSGGSSPPKSGNKSPSKSGDKSPSKSAEKSPTKSGGGTPGKTGSKPQSGSATPGKSPGEEAGGEGGEGEGGEGEAGAEGAQGDETENVEDAQDQQIEDLGEALADEAIEGALEEDTEETTTFNSILEQLAVMVDDIPDRDPDRRRIQLTKQLEDKFTELVTAEGEIDEATKQMVIKVATKIANWMEDVIEEAESRLSGLADGDMTVSLMPPCQRVPSPVTSESVRDWASWIVEAMAVADDWADWISKTVRAAEEKAAKKKGLMIKEDGGVDKLTRKEYTAFKEDVKTGAIDYRMKKKYIAEAAYDWKQKTHDRPMAHRPKPGGPTTSSEAEEGPAPPPAEEEAPPPAEEEAPPLEEEVPPE